MRAPALPVSRKEQGTMELNDNRVEIMLNPQCRVHAYPAYRGAIPALWFTDGTGEELVFTFGPKRQDAIVAQGFAVALARQSLYFEEYANSRLALPVPGWPDEHND
ncbi:hypothetical protein A4R44_08698 [Amycolatopsis sp. M39]|nr:hypothetical protein A4R44_08698 [Amycolatopsis sp. M39]